MRSVGVSPSSLPELLDLNTGTESTPIVLNTFASVIHSVCLIRITEPSPSKMRTWHGTTSKHTNECGDGSLGNFSLSRTQDNSDFVGLAVCGVERLAIVLTYMLASAAKRK